MNDDKEKKELDEKSLKEGVPRRDFASQSVYYGAGITLSLNDCKRHDAQVAAEMGPQYVPNMPKTFKDLALRHITRENVDTEKKRKKMVATWREKLFSAEGIPEICDELPRLLTEFYKFPNKSLDKDNRTVSEALYKSGPIWMRETNAGSLFDEEKRAYALRHVFINKTPIIRKDDLLPGQTTKNFVGPVCYIDTIGYAIWPELKTVMNRKSNPFRISQKVAEKLDKEVFPFWLERRNVVQEHARYRAYDSRQYRNELESRDRMKDGVGIDPIVVKEPGETPKCQEVFERVAFFLSDKATCVSHTVPDFERLLDYGLDGLIDQMKQDVQSGRAQGGDARFLKGVIKVFEGAKVYVLNLAAEARKVDNKEIAKILEQVPHRKARTLHEALVSIWVIYHLMLQENTNFGFSIGRLDQVLNRFYISDWERIKKSGKSEAEILSMTETLVKKAVELISHFFLRCSDHVPLSTEGAEILFAGSGSNQALTVGGTRWDDKKGAVVDACNDMTYIILKATEILSIRDPNVHARYHMDIHHRDQYGNKIPEGHLSAYLKRVCEVNIITRATPAIHGDLPVTKSMGHYYSSHKGISEEEAMKDAHDYASIGCIEQNSNGKHYGNTGSTLFVLPAVLELAMFGGKHRSDGIDANDPVLLSKKDEPRTKYLTTPLWEMKSMDEFTAAFKFHMNDLAGITVANNNYLGRSMQQIRTSPLLSGLFEGPTNKPGEKSRATFRDLAQGGAKYNSSGVAVIGIADVIDSFCVLDRLVFNPRNQDERVSVEELLSAMAVDFEPANLHVLERLKGHMYDQNLTERRLHNIVKLIRYTPKYGKGVATGGKYDNSLSVKYTHVVTKIVHDSFYQYASYRGGRYLVGYWSMTNHAGFGMLAGATPNGRKKGTYFASGITPTAPLVKPGGATVNAMDHLLSVAEVNGDLVGNGYTYNLSLTARGNQVTDKHFFDDTERFAQLMKAFNDNEGILAQMCVTSVDDFVAAYKASQKAANAETVEERVELLKDHKDLMIRVAGYSAYFVTLSPEMQREIIERSNFSLEDDSETHWIVG